MTDRTPPYRSRVSRETRQLIATAFVAIVALWVLARIRFPDRPSTPNPVPALLTQLSSRPALDELASEAADVRARLGTALVATPRAAALRVRDDLAIAVIADEQTSLPRDRATGLTLVPVTGGRSPGAPVPWLPQSLDTPRFLLATVTTADFVSLEPVYIASLYERASTAWSSPIWAVPPGSDLAAGSLLFTTGGELAGVAARDGDQVVIVPGGTLLEAARRLMERPARSPGTIGVDVQGLTASLARATGASKGVVVTWVDPGGAAAHQLMPVDVIEALDGQWVDSRAQWDVRMARLAAGDPLVLGVRRGGEWRDVQVVATTMRPAASPDLGLTLRAVAGIGSQVIRVAPRSAAARAALLPGDVITLVAGLNAPSPAQVQRAFDAAPAGGDVVFAGSRGASSFVGTLQR